ncbi:hypothetical protein HDV57DRAFT_261973 [Trichoderma longibrachiatum]|uniref:Uncharacterized protein n=1 Tax=Trichoderma longibrachiatum ATCC 18648 TaxID=983965 RepID=A0A2T4BTY2_TRILO|nr:hypothetical protein M440DRAFT_1082956 [Trichoderma longibrachiatum ATCC 18648]
MKRVTAFLACVPTHETKLYTGSICAPSSLHMHTSSFFFFVSSSSQNSCHPSKSKMGEKAQVVAVDIPHPLCGCNPSFSPSIQPRFRLRCSDAREGCLVVDLPRLHLPRFRVNKPFQA